MENISVLSVQYVQYSFDYFIESMKKCGVKNIEFWGAIPHYCRLDYTDRNEARKALEDIRDKLSENDMRVIMYTPETLAYPYSFSHPNERVRKRTIDYFEMAMQDALVLGTNRIFLNTGCGLRDYDVKTSWDYTVDTIRKICRLAERYDGIEMVMEQLQPYESNLVCSLDEIKQMVSDVDCENLKVCLDVVAMEATGDSINGFFRDLGDRIVHVHLADSNHQVLGEGSYPIRQYLDDFNKNGYRGYFSLEINDSIYWLDPHSSVEKSMQYLRMLDNDKEDS